MVSDPRLEFADQGAGFQYTARFDLTYRSGFPDDGSLVHTNKVMQCAQQHAGN